MQLEGIHHITAITGDAAQNVDFYVRILGLRLVKKTVNQDDPSVYHLFYADDAGSPGADLTFFEYPGARRGRAGAGMVHRVVFRVADDAALDFWEKRLADHGFPATRGPGSLRFRDPEGLHLELVIDDSGDQPLVAGAPGIPAELALLGFAGARAYAQDAQASADVLAEVLGFGHTGDAAWEARGTERGGAYHYDPSPQLPGVMGAGTVHHIAFASHMHEHGAWLERIDAAGLNSSGLVDRFYFQSIYFREPSGVLIEIATIGPGFAVDEPADKLGERLSLPPRFESQRAQIEQILTPLPAISG